MGDWTDVFCEGDEAAQIGLNLRGLLDRLREKLAELKDPRQIEKITAELFTQSEHLGTDEHPLDPVHVDISVKFQDLNIAIEFEKRNP